MAASSENALYSSPKKYVPVSRSKRKVVNFPQQMCAVVCSRFLKLFFADCPQARQTACSAGVFWVGETLFVFLLL